MIWKYQTPGQGYADLPGYYPFEKEVERKRLSPYVSFPNQKPQSFYTIANRLSSPAT